MRLTEGSVPYPECGLDNVMLTKVPIWECVNGHRDVQIPAVDGLHLVLAQVVVGQPWPLKGQDIRFLRKYLGYSARQFSERLGLHYTTLSRMENGHDRIERDKDALIRLFCATAMCERSNRPFPKSLLGVLEQLESASLDLRDLQIEHVDLTDGIAEPQHAWQEALAGT
jgi:transcriptional regulator with XRE-family HTH domain